MDQVTTVLTQYGAVGILAIVGLLVSKTLFGKMAAGHARELQLLEDALATEQQRTREAEQRAERAQTELARLNETVRSDYLHTLSSANQALAESSRAVAEASAAIHRR